jgi:adenosylcobinamide-phosphate synthase
VITPVQMLAGLVPEPVLWLLGALLWDRLLGEPPAGAHPVVWIGRVIGAGDRRFRRGSPAAELGQGLLLALLVPALFAGATAALLSALADWPWLRLAAGIWLAKSTFAVRGLGEAGNAVRRALANDDLPSARTALGSLCSRDASQLGPEAVAAGAVESLAENASDSLVAPLFWFALFGLPGAIAYRAINTADAMIGYHGRYEYLGKAAARLDDLANWVPARITAGLLLAAGAVRGLPVARGWRILRRDGGRTESPNAGRPMAAMAGLLGVQLEKPEHYRLGDPGERLGPETIARAWWLSCAAMYGAAALTVLCLWARQ